MGIFSKIFSKESVVPIEDRLPERASWPVSDAYNVGRIRSIQVAIESYKKADPNHPKLKALRAKLEERLSPSYWQPSRPRKSVRLP